MRFVGTQEVEPAPEREYRMVPSERWESVLGVKSFDKVSVWKGETSDFTRVEISTRQHIGAPSVICVKDGDEVKKGDKIAESADGLSLPQYASIDGICTVENEKVIISKVK